MNQTILDGQDSACHVMVGSSDATVDGFIITRGRASAGYDDPESYGGGILNQDNSQAYISNCTFTANTGYMAGGGVHGQFATIELTNCIFTDNMAPSGMGGGVGIADTSSVAANGCQFIGNSASSGGGIFYSTNSTLLTSNCTFANNIPNDVYTP